MKVRGISLSPFVWLFLRKDPERLLRPAGCPSRLVVPENGALGVFWFHFIAVADAAFSKEELPRACTHQSVAFCALASARWTCVAPSGKPSGQHR